MRARKHVFPVVIVAMSLLLYGCNRTPAVPAANSPDQSNAAQPQSNGDGTRPLRPAANAGNNPQGAPQQEQAPHQSAELTIPAGTPITVRLQESLSSRSAVPGERFEAELDEPLVLQDRVVAPVGTMVTGHVVVARRSGRLHHPGELGLTLDYLTVGQQNVPLATSHVVARGGSHKKRNWAWIGGGGAGGALIGGLAAGGKGALIGGPIGAVAGTTTAFITGKKDVTFSSERRLRFRLNRDVNLAG